MPARVGPCFVALLTLAHAVGCNRSSVPHWLFTCADRDTVSKDKALRLAKAKKLKDSIQAPNPRRAAETYNLLGAARLILGETGKAKGDFQKSLSYDKNYLPAQINLGVLARIQERRNDARGIYDGILKKGAAHAPCQGYRQWIEFLDGLDAGLTQEGEGRTLQAREKLRPVADAFLPNKLNHAVAGLRCPGQPRRL
ncbi:MAG: hypothetical protein ACTSX8_08240 [Alphaproteobacteria bacterium]